MTKQWVFGDVILQLPEIAGYTPFELLDTKTMGIHLELCPFCKEYPHVIYRRKDKAFSVTCLPCHARYLKIVLQEEGGNPFTIGSGPFHWTYKLQQAIDLWNYRQ